MAKLESFDKNSRQNYIAANAATLITEGGLVNLGIGLPTRVPNYLLEGVELILHGENGYVGVGASPADENDPLFDDDVRNAGGMPSSLIVGGAYIDSPTSFGIIRGGHLKATILGALEVDEHGNIANYMIPGKMVPGMGGAMDLVIGAEKCIVAMEHTNKNGDAKILKDCTLPLTGKGCVDYIVTELCILEAVSYTHLTLPTT